MNADLSDYLNLLAGKPQPAVTEAGILEEDLY